MAMSKNPEAGAARDKTFWWLTPYYEALPFLYLLVAVAMLLWMEAPASYVPGIAFGGAGVIALALRISHRCGCRRRHETSIC